MVELEKRLGISPGTTLFELSKRAFQISPDNPSIAFDPLWFQLPLLDPDYGSYEDCFAGIGTAKNVHAFAFTGGDLCHFGFLMDENRHTDERPIVFVDPGDAAQIVAPDLRSFLGLLSIAFGEVISRQHNNDRWFSFRQEWYGDDPERLLKMATLSRELIAIPGVSSPEDPKGIANAIPSRDFIRGCD